MIYYYHLMFVKKLKMINLYKMIYLIILFYNYQTSKITIINFVKQFNQFLNKDLKILN